MRLRLAVKLPSHLTLGGVDGLLEELRGQGEAVLSMKDKAITFTWDTGDAGEGGLPALPHAGIIIEALEARDGIRAGENAVEEAVRDDFRRLWRQVSGVAEQWEAIRRALADAGIHELPAPEAVDS